MTQRKVLEAMLAYAKATSKSPSRVKEIERRIKEYDLDTGVKCIFPDEDIRKFYPEKKDA